MQVDLSLFDKTRHTPAFLRLEREKPDLKDYCVPANPYFPTPEMFRIIKDKLELILKFYPGSNENICRDLGAALDLDPETLVVSNGSTELITWIHDLFIPDSFATDVPTFGKWTDLPLRAGKKLHNFQRLVDHDFKLDVQELVYFVKKTKSESLCLCNPNNPTSQINSKDEVIYLIENLPELKLIVIDESFIDFSAKASVPSIADRVTSYPNVVLLKSLGKNFGLHGIRAGYSVSNPEIAANLRERIPAWNINAITELLIQMFPDFEEAYERSRVKVVEDTEYLYQELRGVGSIKVFEPHSNFVYVNLTDGDGKDFRNFLLTKYGYLVRECGNKIGSSSQYFRFATRPRKDTDDLIRAILSY